MNCNQLFDWMPFYSNSGLSVLFPTINVIVNSEINVRLCALIKLIKHKIIKICEIKRYTSTVPNEWLIVSKYTNFAQFKAIPLLAVNYNTQEWSWQSVANIDSIVFEYQGSPHLYKRITWENQRHRMHGWLIVT